MIKEETIKEYLIFIVDIKTNRSLYYCMLQTKKASIWEALILFINRRYLEDNLQSVFIIPICIQDFL